MNEYDDSEDYSSSNSFRARSNTWPLNRPDFTAPNGVCIDETLPEIELEEDDLFTTNENWSTGLDHDIMSWDPILSAQNHQQHSSHQQQQQSHLHHQLQQQQQHHHTSQQELQGTAITSNNHDSTTASTTTARPGSNNQQATTIHHHHQPHQQTPTNHIRPQQQVVALHHHSNQHEPLLSSSTVMMSGHIQLQMTQHQQYQQQAPQPQCHQTLNNSHCLESDENSDYHIQQLHHLHLDNNNQASISPNEHQTHYVSTLSSMCVQGSTPTSIGNDNYISTDHQHHHLQPLTSARYDLDQNDLDQKTHEIDINHQPMLRQQMEHMGQLCSTNSSHMLSSSLSTSGIGLSTDLEDLDFKSVDPSSVLQSPSFEEHIPTEQQPSSEPSGSVKQSNSTTSSKLKLNTPRRNAWGNMSYADLISQAINSTNDKRLTLSQIYDWMVQHVPYFKDKGDSTSSAGWKNSVRHNLSLHNRFKRLQNEGTGKSSWWTINPEANVGKCARRRAASMEASKFEKKRGKAKKRAEAVRQGLISYPSLTSSLLNDSGENLHQIHDHQSPNQFSSQTQHQPQAQQHQADEMNSETTSNIQSNTGSYMAPSQKAGFEQCCYQCTTHKSCDSGTARIQSSSFVTTYYSI